MRPSRAGGSSIPPPAAPTLTPSLTYVGGDTLDLSWTGPTPDHFRLWFTNNTVSGWQDGGTIPATAGNFAVSLPITSYYVQGETAGNVATGVASNQVAVDASFAAPVASMGAADEVDWTWTGGNPTQWAYEFSTDDSTWSYGGTFGSPTDRSLSGLTAGFYYRIYAGSNGGPPDSLPSNSVLL